MLVLGKLGVLVDPAGSHASVTSSYEARKLSSAGSHASVTSSQNDNRIAI